MVDWQEAIDHYVKAQEKEWKRPGPCEFRASSLNGCVRQCLRQRVGLSKFGIKALRHFQVGTILHRFIQQEVALGYVGEPVEFERPVAFEYAGIRFTGHVDCYTGNRIYDFKSTANLQATSTFDTNPGYILQLSVYAYALGAPEATLVYIDKRNLEVQEKDIEILPIQKVTEFCREVQAAELVYERENKLPEKDGCYGCRMEGEGDG